MPLNKETKPNDNGHYGRKKNCKFKSAVKLEWGASCQGIQTHFMSNILRPNQVTGLVSGMYTNLIH